MSELRKAAEMVVEALVNASDALRDGDNAGCRWILYEQIYALRQALEQPEREWVGLTDEEIDHIWGITKPDYEDLFDLPRAIEAKLRAKNGF